MDSKLPYHLYMDILSRTSLKTLCTIRCTSKAFEKLTYDPYLLNLHKKRNDIVSGFLVLCTNGCEYVYEFAPSPDSNSLDLVFLPEDTIIRASSEQGIIVFESLNLPSCEPRTRYFVCKPATNQVLALPNPKTKYLTERVAMVVMGSKPLHYKIVRLSEPNPNSTCPTYNHFTRYRCEIFDSNAWAWRLQKDDVTLPSGVFVYKNQPITTKGSIYMLMTNNEVLKFDAYSEKLTTISSPLQILGVPKKPFDLTKLVKYQGKLGFACNIAPRW